MEKSQTLQEYLAENSDDLQLNEVILTTADASKRVAEVIRHQPCGNVGTTNASGDDQNSIDVQANTIFKDELLACGAVSAVASEEEEGILKPEHDSGSFEDAFDPLDGSKEVPHNGICGSIFSIAPKGYLSSEGILGEIQKAAMIVVYGPRTEMLLALNDTRTKLIRCLLCEDGEFRVVDDDVRIADDGNLIAPVSLRAMSTAPGYADWIQAEAAAGCEMRFFGTIAGDTMRLLSKGQGVLIAPPSNEKPNGTHRSLYEARPVAMIMEKAGGQAVNFAGERILDLPINDIHQRTTMIMGGKKMVERALASMKQVEGAC